MYVSGNNAHNSFCKRKGQGEEYNKDPQLGTEKFLINLPLTTTVNYHQWYPLNTPAKYGHATDQVTPAKAHLLHPSPSYKKSNENRLVPFIGVL